MSRIRRKKRTKMTPDRIRRKTQRSSRDPDRKNILNPGLQTEKRQENLPQNPSRNPLREPSAPQSSDRIRQTGPQAEQQMSGFYRIPYCNHGCGCGEGREKRPVPDAGLSLLDRSLLSSYLSAKIRQRPKLASLKEKQLLEVLTLTRGGSPTLAALLLFGIYPQGAFPGFCILAEDGTTDIQADMQTDVFGLQSAFPDSCIKSAQPERYCNQAEINSSVFPEEPGCSVRIEGTLQEMVREAVLFCRETLRRHCDVREEDNVRNLPPVLQQTLWRALLCRDYSACSEHLPIRLSVSSDQIRLHAPVFPASAKPSRNPLLHAMAAVMRTEEQNGTNEKDTFDFLPFAPEDFPAPGFPSEEPESQKHSKEQVQDHFLKQREFVQDGEWHILLTFAGENPAASIGKSREPSAGSQSALTGEQRTNPATVRMNGKSVFSSDKASIREEILSYCFVPRSRREITDRIGKKTSQYIIRRYVMPLVEEGKMAMTLPEKPRSKWQKFYTI